jgi:ParB family chromosome partitioning protein
VPDTSSASPDTVVRLIPTSKITPNPHQPRKQFPESSLTELAASIRANGVIQPVLVRKTPHGFELIAGERRLRAAQIAGVETIPAIVRAVDAPTQAQLALVENIQREDLNPIERAFAYRELIGQLGLTQQELARRTGEERSSVANFLRLLELTQTVRDLVQAGVLSMGHAKVLLGIVDPIEQQKLADIVVTQGLSVRNLERIVENRMSDNTPTSARRSAAHVADIEREISQQVGLRCQVKKSGKSKGTLVIHYATLEEFDQLLDRLGVKLEQ